MVQKYTGKETGWTPLDYEEIHVKDAGCAVCDGNEVVHLPFRGGAIEVVTCYHCNGTGREPSRPAA